MSMISMDFIFLFNFIIFRNYSLTLEHLVNSIHANVVIVINFTFIFSGVFSIGLIVIAVYNLEFVQYLVLFMIVFEYRKTIT